MKIFMKFSYFMQEVLVLMEDIAMLGCSPSPAIGRSQWLNCRASLQQGYALLMGDSAIGKYPSWRVPVDRKLYK